MEKSYTGRYPEIRDKQFDFLGTVVSMLNCRRYLENHLFEEDFENSYYKTSISGTVVFPDGSIVDGQALIHTKNPNTRDSLLERIISERAVFKRHPVNLFALFNYVFYERNKVIMTHFKDKGYDFKLSVIDTTREKAIIPIRWFLIKPRGFGFKYDICLTKGVINDADLKDFEKYKEGLSDAARSDVLINYGSGSGKGSSSAGNGIKTAVQVKPLEVFDPWKIEIDELENIAYGNRNYGGGR